jgi:DNA polymerase III alpha subunit
LIAGFSLAVDAVAAESSGATFFRGDLHIHSHGASYDCHDSTATPDAIVRTAQAEGIAVIALADHNDIRNVRAAVTAGEMAGVLVVPAVELSTPEGHLLCYAATADALERFSIGSTLRTGGRRIAAVRPAHFNA